MGPACSRNAAIRLLSFPEAGTGMRDRNISYEIEIFHIGENNGNPDLVCDMKCCIRRHFIRVCIVCRDKNNLQGQKNIT